MRRAGGWARWAECREPPALRTGAFSARRAAAANSPAVWYRSSDSLAMPFAMTSSNAASFSSVADGRGGGDTMWPVICCSRLSAGYGREPVRHSYSTQVSA